MNWNQILEKSWHYLVKRRYLIWLGVLAALTEGGFIYSGGNYRTSGKDLENSANFKEIMSVVASWVSSHLMEITIVVIALFLIRLIILYISYSARAGLIYGVNVLEAGKDSNFHQDFEAGKSFFWRFLGLRILIVITLMLIQVLLILSLIGAFVLASSYSAWLILPIALLCIPVVFGFVLLAVYLSLASALAERFIVIKNLPIIESIDKAIHLVREKIAVVVIAWLIYLVINIVSGIACLILIVIPVVISIIFGSIAYLIGKDVGLMIVIPLGIVLILTVNLLAQGIFTTYLSAYWTIIYKRLVESS